MSEYLFAYGTLQPDHVAEEIASTVARFRTVGRGHVRGSLYDLGEYPGAILSASSQKRIIGTVFELPEDPDVLKQLDEYEGFDPRKPAASLFVRKLHPVTLAAGRTVRCWVYEYNGNPESARLLANGSYRRKPARGSRPERTGPARAARS
jgi:gamma-glutamylcyclotransferase (GGCT)/AIG2-like uncharacterized protein YtfP